VSIQPFQLFSWRNLVQWSLIASFAVTGAVLATSTHYLSDPQRFLPTSEYPLFAALPAIGFFLCIGLILSAVRTRPNRAIWLFLAAFGLRLIVGILLTYLFQFDDERGQHEWAQLDVALWEAGREARRAGHMGYQWLLTVLYYVFGVNLLVIKAFNALLGALLPFLLYDLAGKVFPEKPAIANRVLYFGIFLPPLVIFSGVNLKEVPTAFAITLVFWLLCIPPWRKLWRLAAGLGGLVFTYYLRRGWFFFPLMGLLTYVVLGDRWFPRKLLTTKRLVSGLAIVSIILVLLLPIIQDGQEYAQWLQERPESESKFQTVAGGATVGQFLDTQNRFSPRNMVVLVTRAVFTPSPLRIVFNPSIDVLLEGSIMLTWYILLPLAIVSILVYWQRGMVIAWAVSTGAIFVVTALGTSFAGDVFRHRIVLFPLLYLLASSGYDETKRYRWIVWGWAGAAVLFTLLYLRLRN
jgi:4-amino-4-deoxy-L-arabinose transferase-like glycosyltransferase